MAEIINLDRELVEGFKPVRPEDGHKNTFGQAIICAGSEFMTGAAVMACGAALRSGAGLVKVFSEEKTLNAISINEPCALLELRPDNTALLIRTSKKLCEKTTSVLIGSGIPADHKNMEALTGVFLESSLNVVLDAGALSGKPDVLERLAERLKARKIPAVITPHIGEFTRMLRMTTKEVSDRAEELASGFAVENNVVVVLKGSRTLIATPDGKIYVNDLPNSGLAKGGSGDVLAGLITGFLAQGMEPYKAAASAVYIHSKTGEIAAEEVGARYMLPEDLIIYLPEGYQEAGWRD